MRHRKSKKSQKQRNENTSSECLLMKGSWLTSDHQCRNACERYQGRGLPVTALIKQKKGPQEEDKFEKRI